MPVKSAQFSVVIGECLFDRYVTVLVSCAPDRGRPFVEERSPLRKFRCEISLFYCALTQVSEPVSFAATFVKVMVTGLPSAVPR